MRRIIAATALALLAACGGGGGSSTPPTPPTAPTLAAIADQTGRELVRLTFTVSATGTAPVTLAASGLPAGATFDPATGVFDWTPAEGALGGYDVTFSATNDAGTDSKKVHLTVGRRAPFDPVPGVAGPAGVLQFIANQDTDADPVEQSPTAANKWDIAADFAVYDGGNDQWDSALQLRVGPVGDGSDPAFGEDQTYAELTFSGPVVTYAQGLKAVSVGKGTWERRGIYSAVLTGTALTTLSQPLDLTGAVAPVTLSVYAELNTRTDYISLPDPYLHVVLRDAGGNLLTTLDDGRSGGAAARTYDLSTYAGQRVTLAFEASVPSPTPVVVDDVSVTDANHTEFVHNGDFETGDLTGWTPGATQSLTLTSGVRALSGLNVTRSFYSPLGAPWGRMIDVFENPGETAVTAFARYATDMGSDGAGVLFLAADGKSLSGFDGDGRDRDLGLVFGGTVACTPALSWASATALNTKGEGPAAGSEFIYEKFPITVPAHGKVALVHFVIQTGVDTRALAGTSVATHPAEVEAAATAIVAGWGVDPIYQDYLSADVRAAILNF